MKSDNHNKAITNRRRSPAGPEKKAFLVNLPILVPAERGSGDGYWWQFKTWGKPDANNRLQRIPVTAIPLEKLNKSRIGSAGMSPAWERHYARFIELVQALQGGQDEIKKFAAKNLLPEYREVITQDPYAWLSAHFDSGVSGPGQFFVKIVFWKKLGSQKLRPGLFCISENSIPFIMAAYNVASLKGRHICKRCGTDFPSRGETHEYCTTNCRVAAAMKRYRAKKKMGL